MQRSHVPKLTPDKLTLALQQLEQSPLDNAAKGMIGAILTAASNPSGETPEAIIPTLPAERRANIRTIGQQYHRLQRDVTRRGTQGLNALSETEWQQLVDEANSE